MSKKEKSPLLRTTLKPVVLRLTCTQPDHDIAQLRGSAKQMLCGYPLPCPWHSAEIDLTTQPPRLSIPVTAGAALANVRQLGKIARALKR